MLKAKWRRFRHSLLFDHPQLRKEHPSYRWLVLMGVMIATFMSVLDSTIVNVALSKLMASFGVSVDRVEWVMTAYLLAFGVILPVSGWIADHWGYKLVFTSGLLLFTGASFLCSLAWSLEMLISARILQGIGAAILMPVGMAIITREFPPEKRGIALAFWSMAASASVSLGPTIGGWLIDHYSWHAVFDVNVPIGIVGILAAVVILHEYRTPHTRTFDSVGFVTLVGFLTPLLLALSSGNSAWNTGGWTSNYILTCFSISIVSLVIFLVTEFTVEHPLIAVDLFKDVNFSMCNLVGFLFGLGMFGSTFLLPIYLQESLGYTPLQAGMVFLPVGVLQAAAAPLAAVFAARFSPKIPIVIGIVLMAITFYQFSTLSYLSESHAITTPLMIRGFAMGVLFAPLTALAIGNITHFKIAQASGLLNVIRQIGGSFGVALFGSLLTRRTIFHLTTYGQQINTNSETFQRTVRQLGFHAWQTTGGTLVDATARGKAQIGSFVANQAFVSAIDDVFLLAGAVILLGVVPILFVRIRKGKKRGPGTKPAIAIQE
ncbi:Drug resistance transporter, EmrB/QacA subfamily [Candidatus Zixiibacteriota bacterium]|nr:Drug resistance transporter, EmrB/QacA subfamily [candidate division Zixibacteria bacterium]